MGLEFVTRQFTDAIYRTVYASDFEHVVDILRKESAMPDWRFVCGGMALGLMFGRCLKMILIGGLAGYLIGVIRKESMVTMSQQVSKLANQLERIALCEVIYTLVGGRTVEDIDSYISSDTGKQRFCETVRHTLTNMSELKKSL